MNSSQVMVCSLKTGLGLTMRVNIAHLGLILLLWLLLWASLVAQRLKCLPGMQETWFRSLRQEDPLEKEMATLSSTLAWKIPLTEEPGRLEFSSVQFSRSVVSDSL